MYDTSNIYIISKTLLLLLNKPIQNKGLELKKEYDLIKHIYDSGNLAKNYLKPYDVNQFWLAYKIQLNNTVNQWFWYVESTVGLYQDNLTTNMLKVSVAP